MHFEQWATQHHPRWVQALSEAKIMQDLLQKCCTGEFTLHSAPSHMVNWGHRSWKPCRLMALINIANKLATGCHQTGSSYRPDSQQVCKVVVELWLVVKARVSPLTSKKPIFCPKALLLPSVALLQCQSWHGPCQEWITQAPPLSTQCLPRYILPD